MKGVHNPCFCFVYVCCCTFLWLLWKRWKNRPILHPRPYNINIHKLTICIARVLVQSIIVCLIVFVCVCFLVLFHPNNNTTCIKYNQFYFLLIPPVFLLTSSSSIILNSKISLLSSSTNNNNNNNEFSCNFCFLSLEEKNVRRRKFFFSFIFLALNKLKDTHISHIHTYTHTHSCIYFCALIENSKTPFLLFLLHHFYPFSTFSLHPSPKAFYVWWLYVFSIVWFSLLYNNSKSRFT